ncbi:hypothetical protein EJD97_014167, partial [Solanum chilense]
VDDKCLYLGIDDYSHENLKNYLISQAMLSSRVDGDSHKWIDARNRGKTDELIRKKKSRRSLQERWQEIIILRLFMRCHSCHKLEL